LILIYMSLGKIVYCTFVDLSKAFDTIFIINFKS
jgi:hypothetical protein